MASEMRLLQIILLCTVCSLWVTESVAQEITPRLFWPTPIGTKVIVTGYSYSNGDLLLDSSIPVEGADSEVNTGVLAYMQTLDLWGRTSNMLVTLPYSSGTAKGLLFGNPIERDFGGFGDLSLTLNVNIKGAPAMTVDEFRAFRANPQPLIGVSLKVLVPTGHYNPNKVINVGANRWAAKLKLGTVLILKPKWLLELSAGTWIFADDDDFVMGKKEVEPIFVLEANIIKRIHPGLWASLDIAYFRGGRQTIDGTELNNSQRNVKLGGMLVVPFHGRHAIKFGYGSSIITRFGSDSNHFLLSYQVLLN